MLSHHIENDMPRNAAAHRAIPLGIALPFAVVTALLSLRAPLPAAEPVAIPLWPQGAPGAKGETAADRPEIHIHRPKQDVAVGAAVVICPGGGYGGVMMSYEGHDVARWLNTFGVTGIVLRYRIAPRYRHPAPLQDVQRAVRWVRSRARDLEIDPARIGVLGFSAGGHLAATAGTLFEPGKADADDPIERVSSRPDFLVLAYPVITLLPPSAHMGSRYNLLGKDASDDAARAMSPETRVTRETPPTFLFHTSTDRVVSPENSVLFYRALLEAGVPAELHVYRDGPHGVGLDRHPSTRGWPEQCRQWLDHLGVLAPYDTGAPRWIWAGQETPDGDRIAIRRVFEVDGAVDSAVFAGTCDNHMTAWLNGEKVATSHVWENPIRVDLKKHLRPGANVFAVDARNDGSIAGFVGRIEIKAEASGKTRTIATDDSWLVTREPADGWRGAEFDASDWQPATEIAPVGEGGWEQAVTESSLENASAPRPPQATTVAQINVLDGFRVELLYSVPKGEQGSWVNLCVDSKGRLITSDQGGSLYRITPPPIGAESKDLKVERIDLDIGQAHGLVHAFDSLYVVRNGRGSGLYRVRDTDGDDRYDEVKLLRSLRGGGEHGPHAVIPGPRGKSLYVLGGNHTDIPSPERSVVPRVWAEDHLLGRMWDASGHARGKLAPGGWVARTDPEGKTWELFANGFRNQFDIAFNHHGDLFTFDADMEWDVGTAWYRPTRVNHVTSGSEFGWRSGTGKWPDHYADSLGSVADIGPGSPTGIAFGYGARFPEKYQKALYICDWSYGKLYAVHMTEDGSSWTGEPEQFVAASPLPLSDVAINPHDGALYFTIGGRSTQSGLYRVTAEQPTASRDFAATDDTPKDHPRAIRQALEKLHGRAVAGAVDTAWKYLSHDDRAVRFAARVAIEHQPVDAWRRRAVAERKPIAAIEAAIALARHGDASDRVPLLANLARLEWAALPEIRQLGLLRAHALIFLRLGPSDDATKAAVAQRFSRCFPAESARVNAELAELLIYLGADGAVAKTVRLLLDAPTQEEQIGYALQLRNVQDGWTADDRRAYLDWFNQAQGFHGGHSFRGFLRNIKARAVAALNDEQKRELADVVADKPPSESYARLPKPQGPGREWQLAELVALTGAKLRGRDFESGRRMFSAALCFQCHRFAGRGGSTGPDLTGLAGRFSPRDMLESLLEPSKVISDQYQATTFILKNGRVVHGRIVNAGGDNWSVNTDMTKPDGNENVNRNSVLQIVPSTTSMMPEKLLDPLNEKEVLDLLAYLLSRGDRTHAMFE